MPRFFFNVYHKRPSLDEAGADLADHKAAWVEATKTCGEMMKDIDGNLEVGTEWRMEVVDERGSTLFVIRVSAEAGPAFRRS